MPAGQTVSDKFELLECILHKLPTKDLLFAQVSQKESNVETLADLDTGRSQAVKRSYRTLAQAPTRTILGACRRGASQIHQRVYQTSMPE